MASDKQSRLGKIVRGAGRGVASSTGFVAESLYRAAFAGDPLVEGIADSFGREMFSNYGKAANNVSANGRVQYEDVRQPDGTYKRVKRVIPGGGFGGRGGSGRDFSRGLQALGRQLSDNNRILSQSLRVQTATARAASNLIRVTAKMSAAIDSVGQNVIAMKTQQDNQRLSDEAYRKSADIKLHDKLDEIKNALLGKNTNEPKKKSGIFDFIKNALLTGLGVLFNPLKKLLPLLTSLGGLLGNSLGGILGSAAGSLLGKGGFVRRAVGGLLGATGLKKVGTKIADIASAGKTKIVDLAGKGLEAFRKSSVVTGMKNVVTGAKSKIVDLATKFAGLVRGGGVKKLLSVAGRGLLRGLMFVPVIGEVAAGIFLAVELYSLVKDFTKDLNFGDAFSNMGSGIVDSFKKMKNGLMKLFGLGPDVATGPLGPENSYGVNKNDTNTQPASEAIDFGKNLTNRYLSVPSIATPLKLPAVVKPSEVPTGFTTAGYVGAGESSGSYDSINKTDSGGTKSYGKYQFNSGAGVVQKFINTSSFKSEFDGVAVGSDEFDERWKNMSNSTDAFKREQDEFFNKEYRDAAIAKFKNKYGIEPGRYTEAVITGMQVRGGRVLNNAMKAVDPSGYDNDKSLAIALLEASRNNVKMDYETGIADKTSTVAGLQRRVDEDIERIRSGDLSPSLGQNVRRVAGEAGDIAKEGFGKFMGVADQIGQVTTDLFTGKMDIGGIMDNIGELFKGANIPAALSSPGTSPVQEYLNKKIEENQMIEAQSMQSSGGNGGSASSSVISTPVTTTNNTTIINNETPSIERVFMQQYF